MSTAMGPPPPKTLDEAPASSSSTSSVTAPLDPPPPKFLTSDTPEPEPRPERDPNDSVTSQEPAENLPEAESGGVQETSEPPPAHQSARGAAPPYTIPPWSGPPCHQFSLEVLKDGSIIDQLHVHEKGAYMFGRVDLCDFVLEHPTISRFHAVLQFKRSGEAYLYDLGSTHGTSINKNQVKSKVYVDLHVGDVIRFGLSSRLYIFQGPSELMLPETNVKIIRDVKMREEMLDREASLQRARREASLADGISWGMGEDAIEEAEDDADEITWQTYKGQLTEKQEKTRDKILKRTEKISHMRKEIDAIRAKDIAQGGLTQGQQTQIARNEQRMTQIMEELENLEETLNDSIRESIGARAGKITHGKKKGATEDDEEYLSDDDDDFYDRTKRKSSNQKVGESQSIETADTLLDKKDGIMKEMEGKKEVLSVEKNKFASETALETKAGDALDAFMSGLSSQLVLDKTSQLEKELSTLQSELDRICYLLKFADPTGEAAKKRDVKAQQQEANKSDTPAVTVKKQLPLAPKGKGPEKQVNGSKPKEETAKGKGPEKHVDGSKPKEETTRGGPEKQVSGSEVREETTDSTVDSGKKTEAVKIVSDTTEGKTTAYTVPKPQWLGAVEDRKTKETQQEAPLDQHEPDNFVDYKDRKNILGGGDGTQTMVGSGIEGAAPGLIIRKRKQVEKSEGDDKNDSQRRASSSTGAVMAEDAVALLLKHEKGYSAAEDEETYESQDISGGNQSSKEAKKPKRVLGPEKPSFLNSNPDYESWVPPKGQTGDGRTSLNERFGY